MAKALAFMAAMVLGLPGCSPFGGGAFTCTDDLVCKRNRSGDGRCEPNGFCSFESSTCGGGRIYGEHSGDLSNQCVGESVGPDAKQPDATHPEAGDVCFGSPSSFAQPCFSTAPTGTVVLTGNIDTGPGGLMCSNIVSNTTACVIAADTIRVASGTTVTATGARPLVLVATTTIDIAGTLDVASHHGPTPGNGNDPFTTAQIGAAADTGVCGAFGAPQASGGGAGGTLGGLGGTGGGGGAAGNTGGTPAPVTAVTELRGGCIGQTGATGTAGTGGHSGGAVWLIANTSITISGALNASGEGGHPGVNGNGGAGGGGSGGLIGVDAPAITNTGAVYANAGAGGEGSGNQTRGAVGNEPTSAAAAPPPTSISNGGVGGAGGAGTATGGAGETRTGFGGGGGGGGVGVMKVFRGTLGGNVSPNPS